MALQYKEYGNKNAPLILFIHGGGVSGWMWDKQVQYFTNYYCIVPDLIDEGEGMDESDFSIKYSAEKLLALIEEKTNGKPVIVIGFSLGAQILVQMLSIKPQIIDYAIINSALVKSSPFSEKIIRPLVKLSFPLTKNKFFSKLQAKTMYIDNEYFENYFHDSSKMKLATLIRILQENMLFEIPENFSDAKCKILVTVGEKEKSLMKKSAIDLVKNNPNCKCVIFPGIGHGISFAKPNFFNRMLENWIKDGHLPSGKVIE